MLCKYSDGEWACYDNILAFHFSNANTHPSISTEILDQGYVVSMSQSARYNLLSLLSLLLHKFTEGKLNKHARCFHLIQPTYCIVSDIARFWNMMTACTTHVYIIHHTKAMSSLKSDFVFAFVRCVDGERDPRNLLLAFHTFLDVVREIPEFTTFAEVSFPSSPLIISAPAQDVLFLSRSLSLSLSLTYKPYQELFEVVSVYFPITFTPKPNDPTGITKEELVLSLRWGLYHQKPLK